MFFCGKDQAREDIGFVIFSLFNVIWATVYLEAWKRYSAELAYRWGTLDQRNELLVEPRPLFTVSFFLLQIECWNLNFGPLAGPVGEEPGDRAAGTDLPRMEAQCVPLLCQRAHHRIVFGCGFYRHVSHPRTAGETFENRITLPTGIFA